MKVADVRILDVRIDNINLTSALHRAEEFLAERKLHHIVTPGPEFLLEATAHREYQRILNQADLSIPDGIGLRLGAFLIGQKLHHRVAGVDFVEQLMSLAAKRGKSVYLYGGLPNAAEKSALVWLKRYPGLQIVGAESGHRGAWWGLKDHIVLERIHRAKPNILFVALGAPKQELWIERHRRALHDVQIAMGVGRTFDYVSGLIQRPPAAVRKFGLEWLYTYLLAHRFYHGALRRQRVKRATWHFLREVIQRRRS